MTFGEKCLQFRAKYGLTQQQLGQIFGVTKITIFRYEKGKFNPSRMKEIRFERKMKEWEEINNENV